MPAFLVKTEPEDFSFDDLVQKGRARWDGVKNPVALKHLRTIRTGDTVVVYHTGKQKSVVGVGRAASDAYPDPKLEDEQRAVFDLEPVRALKTPVALATFRTDPELRDVALVRQPRLSVMPLTPAQLDRLLELGGVRR